jgi:hypothetical protein
VGIKLVRETRPIRILKSRHGSSSIDPIPFPGFHDAFAPRPKSASKDKGKGRSVVPETPVMPQALRSVSQHNFSDPFEIHDLGAPSNADDVANSLQEASPDDSIEEAQFVPTFKWSHEASVP